MSAIKKAATYLIVGGAALVAGSPALMSFLGKWEGEGQYVVYADKLAGGLPTVCKGITKHTSPYPVVVGERWSKEKCAEVEEFVVISTQKHLKECIKHPISQNTFDALTSHAHNFGWPATCKSQSVREINKGNILAGCNLLAYTPTGKPNWSYVNGVFYQGLLNRRIEERDLCRSGLN